MTRSDLILHLMKDGKQRTTVEILDILYPTLPAWRHTSMRSNIYDTLRKLEKYNLIKMCGRNNTGCSWVIA